MQFYLALLPILSLITHDHIGLAVNSTREHKSVGERCHGYLCAFNPALLGGVRGLPGVRARFNPRMFRYVSQILGEKLSREIQRARLPEIVQSMQPLLHGHIVLFNGYVARYRCPQRVVVLPKSPDRILLQLQNYDVGINADVTGEVDVMVPFMTEAFTPHGKLRIDIRGITLEVEILIKLGSGGPKITVISCSNHIDGVDIRIEKTNSLIPADSTVAFFKKFGSKFIRDMLPGEICKMVPTIVDEHVLNAVNSKFTSIPETVALTQLASLTGLGLFSAPIKDPVFCAQQCGITLAANTTAGPTPAPSRELDGSTPQRHPLCSQCGDTDDKSSSMMKRFAKALNLQKLTDMFLSVKVLNNYASDTGFTVDLDGELSPGGQGGTPFGPFPILFPAAGNDRMLETIVSDFTINSLLYWAQRKGIINFRVGPEHPTLGGMLKTTCEEDYGDSKEVVEAPASTSIGDLGICIGTIFPKLADHQANKHIALQIRTMRAPSIIFSAKDRGSILVDVQAEADLLINGTKTKLGTLTAEIQLVIAPILRGQKIFGTAQIAKLKLTDPTGTLGNDQDALDNAAQLGKEMISTQACEALSKGLPLHIFHSPAQPFTLYNLQVKIVEHGIYVAADLTISPAILGTLYRSDSCYRF